MKDIKNNSVKADVTGSILLHKHKNRIIVQSKSNFFANEIVIKIEHDKLRFRIAGLDDNKTVKPYKRIDGWYQIEFVGEKETGKFDFDEDSTIDEVIIYCQ